MKFRELNKAVALMSKRQEYDYVVEFLQEWINRANMEDDDENARRGTRALIAFQANLNKNIFTDGVIGKISNKDRVIYKLEIEIIGYDWENTEIYFFKTANELETFIKEYDQQHTNNGKYIPTISSIHYNAEDTILEREKHIMTISQYEELFGVEP